MIEITLIKPHQHLGKHYPAGAELTVTQAEANWLREHKIATIKKGKNHATES